MSKPWVRQILLPLLIIAVFLIVRYVGPYTAKAYGTSGWMRIGIYYAWYAIPVILWVGFQSGWGKVWGSIGLNRGFLKALAFGLVCTLPMLLGYALTGSWNEEMTWKLGVVGALLPGFFEEFLYRGFLFAQLFRKAKWGFVLAAGINAVVFGMGHFWQGESLGESAGIFLITFMGAAWFAWLYMEWKFNLWVPIFMHVLMNLYWTMFSIESNAMGGVWANVFRALTIAATVFLTLHYRKPLRIRKDNLLINPD